MQRGYKIKKPTIAIVYHTTRNFVREINGQIQIDLSKALDKVDRGKLRGVLYGKELPASFIKMLKIGHNNHLCSKINGEYSELLKIT